MWLICKLPSKPLLVRARASAEVIAQKPMPGMRKIANCNNVNLDCIRGEIPANQLGSHQELQLRIEVKVGRFRLGPIGFRV